MAWEGGTFPRAEWNGAEAIPVMNEDGTQSTIEIKPKDFGAVYGHYSHVEGSNNLVLGSNSHAEGGGNLVINNYSHVEGKDNRTLY